MPFPGSPILLNMAFLEKRVLRNMQEIQTARKATTTRLQLFQVQVAIHLQVFLCVCFLVVCKIIAKY